MKNYVITGDTLAILPYSTGSIIYETNQTLIINKLPNNIISYNCLLFGSSYKGRVKGSKNLIGFKYKNPISINDSLIFFPTTSPRLKECSWINYINVKKVDFINNINMTKIQFINDLELKFHISKNIINNQINKSYILNSKIHMNLGYFV
jgi:competence protein ComK